MNPSHSLKVLISDHKQKKGVITIISLKTITISWWDGRVECFSREIITFQPKINDQVIQLENGNLIKLPTIKNTEIFYG